MRAKTVAAVIGGAFALVALTAGAAQAGHHQTHSVPGAEETVAGGPYKPTEETVAEAVFQAPYRTGDALNNPSPLG
ncbi:hypothetical protein JIX56_47435 [Streptomyces sp. CA-210063]|uniref:hypothetical protein n=1 Tax=Streptomyces sp. CA-210063 TaxID=2801029 RepID=UPI00214C88AD|nr:hypothetical protein [Streptomyces sp. CA-210063]UUU36821.1 hypothetical protein JIX56_47435 [Streptomyces sp. CA-210063]